MFDTNYQKKIIEVTKWIKKTVHGAGFQDVIVAVSGGVDSAVSLLLAVQALGKEHVYAVLLPYEKISPMATVHGKLVTQIAGLSQNHIIQKDIAEVVDTILKQIQSNNVTNIRKGNVMARVRMTFIYDLAKEKNALVLGTENKSEYYLGYFTRFGDEASDLEPIRDFYKTQVWEIAKILHIPGAIIAKPPSAELWDKQTDEEDFGFSYKDADKILYHLFEQKLSFEDIISLGFATSLVTKVLQRVKANEFKHHLPTIFNSTTD